jgi:hypothetical protein
VQVSFHLGERPAAVGLLGKTGGRQDAKTGNGSHRRRLDMTRTRTTSIQRLGALPAAVVLALVAALLLALPRSGAAAATASTPQDGHSHGVVVVPHTPAQVALHDQVRKLWEDHITWTRLAIVEFAAGDPGFDATAARLLQNQTDLGDAIKPFYGDAAGERLTALLRDHILIAVDLLQAAKSGDSAAVASASARWYANANDIADFLAAANPRFWPDSVMRAAMKEHLDETLAEAVHELSRDYAASVTDYEKVHAHILAMADTISGGIIGAFPSRLG